MANAKTTKINQRGTDLGHRIQHLVSDNGVWWTGYYLTKTVLSRLTDRLDQRMRQLEVRNALPGVNSRQKNYATWQHWDWSRQGEEWTVSPEWKQALIQDVMLKYVEPAQTVLEIGPGGGRWTETLQQVAKHLIVVDLTNKCIEVCKVRFSYADNIEFHVNDGKSLDFVPSKSVNFVWSFDVFVHIAPADIDSYLGEISRVLKKGGCGIIHHANVKNELNKQRTGWRSSMTVELFASMLRKHGLKLVTQLDAWGPGNQFNVHTNGDFISVFEK
jgi:SAM-dependent methyltransferase